MSGFEQTILGLNGFELSAIGLVLGAGGITATLIQVFRTKRSVDAASEAISRTERHLAVSHVLTLVPQLIFFERLLDDAVIDDDRKAARRCLADWRTTASEVRGLLAIDARASEDLRSSLQKSAVEATQAKSKLMDGRTAVAKTTESAREAIATACQELNVFAGTLRSYAGEKR